MTRTEALESGSVTYFDGKRCSNGHIANRYTANYRCVLCSAIGAKARIEGMSAEERASLLEKENEWKRKKAAAKKLVTDAKEAERREVVKVLMVSLGLDLPLSRQEAKDAGSQFYFNGKPCPKGHIVKRQTIEGCCFECAAQSGRENMKRAREGRPEEMKERKKADYERHKSSRIATVKKYAKENVDKIRLKALAYSKRCPEVRREISATRRARRRNATPPWLTKEMREVIKAMHRMAEAMEKELGIQFDADHIVPLDGRIVCGLHVPWNLRLITHSQNASRPKIFSEPFIGRDTPLPLGCGAALNHYQL